MFEYSPEISSDPVFLATIKGLWREVGREVWREMWRKVGREVGRERVSYCTIYQQYICTLQWKSMSA